MCAEFNALTRSFGACFCLLGIGVTVQSLTLSEVWAESLFATNMVINLTKPLLGRSQRPGAPPPSVSTKPRYHAPVKANIRFDRSYNKFMRNSNINLPVNPPSISVIWA